MREVFERGDVDIDTRCYGDLSKGFFGIECRSDGRNL